jgi:hypothetical protein
MMRALDVIKPWRFTGGEATRDAWRVRCVRTFLPWVVIGWRMRTDHLAQKFTNRPLLAALKAHKAAPIIVTAGFLPIVTPLIAALGVGDWTVVASRGFGFSDRRRGKLLRATESLGAETVGKSLVITDSEQDHELLSASARPLRTVWPEARFRRALSGVYLPGEYLTQIKRPGERYLFRGILQEDFAFWILSTLALAAMPIAHIAGLTCLLISFWAIYERGYVDNDLIAAALEKQPKLSAAFHGSTVATPVIQPWIWAVAAGVAGIFVLRWPDRPLPSDFAKWLAVLAATHVWFKLYNRMDKGTRVWTFPFLQFARSAAPLILVPAPPIGVAALGAQTLARWVPYYVYRMGGKDWPKTHTHLIRLLFLVVLGALLVLTEGVASILNWTALALLLWSVFRARDELLVVIRASHWLKREHPGS